MAFGQPPRAWLATAVVALPPLKNDHLVITDSLRISPAPAFSSAHAVDAPSLPLGIPPRGTARHQRAPPRDSSP
eukprot:11439035-Alexandrium_andersonii.AAC.1